MHLIPKVEEHKNPQVKKSSNALLIEWEARWISNIVDLNIPLIQRKSNLSEVDENSDDSLEPPEM